MPLLFIVTKDHFCPSRSCKPKSSQSTMLYKWRILAGVRSCFHLRSPIAGQRGSRTRRKMRGCSVRVDVSLRERRNPALTGAKAKLLGQTDGAVGIRNGVEVRPNVRRLVMRSKYGYERAESTQSDRYGFVVQLIGARLLAASIGRLHLTVHLRGVCGSNGLCRGRLSRRRVRCRLRLLLGRLSRASRRCCSALTSSRSV